MKIIIGTKAIPKVEAVKNGIKELPYIDIKKNRNNYNKSGILSQGYAYFNKRVYGLSKK